MKSGSYPASFKFLRRAGRLIRCYREKSLCLLLPYSQTSDGGPFSVYRTLTLYHAGGWRLGGPDFSVRAASLLRAIVGDSIRLEDDRYGSRVIDPAQLVPADGFAPRLSRDEELEVVVVYRILEPRIFSWSPDPTC